MNDDLLHRVADDVWVVDAHMSAPMGLRVPVRMTIIRLPDGALILHSPIAHSAMLQAALEALGRITYLVAPSVAHWLFVRQWQRAVPGAMTFAVPALAGRSQVRKSGLRIDRKLSEVPPPEWQEQIQIVILSASIYVEAALYHVPTRTLVLTDIIQNMNADEFPALVGAFLRAVGSAKPNAMAPAYLRLLTRLGGQSFKASVARLISLEPSKVIFAHGEWFAEDGAERLRHSLRWV